MPGPVEAAVRAFLPRLPAGTSLTVACSGGADSLALAWAVRRVVSVPVRGLVVDHGLQPGSAAQAERAAAQLRTLGLDAVEVRSVQVEQAGGLEAAARTARYAALQPGSDREVVLLGHTLDDQAETVLLGLARGSGPRSIAGMRAWRAPWGRPLLGVRRTDTQACCRAAGLTWWDDPHNADSRFTRVRLRREVLPLLEDVLGGGVAPALARTAALMSDDLAALDELAVRLLARASATAGVGSGLRVSTLRAEPSAVRRRALRLYLQELGITDLTFDHLRRVEALLDGSGAVRLPGGADLGVVAGELVIVDPTPGRDEKSVSSEPKPRQTG